MTGTDTTSSSVASFSPVVWISYRRHWPKARQPSRGVADARLLASKRSWLTRMRYQWRGGIVMFAISVVACTATYRSPCRESGRGIGASRPPSPLSVQKSSCPPLSLSLPTSILADHVSGDGHARARAGTPCRRGRAPSAAAATSARGGAAPRASASAASWHDAHSAHSGLPASSKLSHTPTGQTEAHGSVALTPSGGPTTVMLGADGGGSDGGGGLDGGASW